MKLTNLREVQEVNKLKSDLLWYKSLMFKQSITYSNFIQISLVYGSQFFPKYTVKVQVFWKDQKNFFPVLFWIQYLLGAQMHCIFD